VVEDNYNTIKDYVAAAVESSDVVFLSGGSSMDDKDYTYDILKELSNKEPIVHGLNIKPGKPTIVADVNGKPVIGLPGQPASALIVLNQMLDTLYKVFYQTRRFKPCVMAKLNQSVASAPGRRTYQMVQLEQGDAAIEAKVIRGKSGMISLLSQAYGYIVIGENREGMEAEETVAVFPLQ